MKRQPLISSYSKVFNFCFNLLDALSLVFKHFHLQSTVSLP